MPVNDTRAKFDTFTAEEFPTTNHGDRQQLNVSGGTGTHRYGYVWWSGMAPRPSVVTSATLRLWLRGSGWSGGPHTITARLITDTWSENALTWTRSGAGQMGSTQFPASVQVTGGISGQMVEIDVTDAVAFVAAGEPWHGFRLEVDTAGIKQFYSKDTSTSTLRPQLEIEWNRAPVAPTDLAPTGNGSVSLSHPTLDWVFRDLEGDQQAEFQVQVDDASSFATPVLDTGFVASSVSQLNLASTAYAGIANGATQWWRVRVKDTSGLTSAWTAPQQFRRDVKGVLNISNPPPVGTVDETTPPIITTLTGRDQEAISYALWELTNPPREVWNYTRGLAPAVDGAPEQFNIPAGKLRRADVDYRLYAWSWDTVDREATPGDPPYVQASVDFSFVRSATPLPVTSLTVVEKGPGVQLTWSRDALVGVPDYWCLVLDGRRIYDRLNPEQFDQGGGEYSMLYYGAPHKISHTWEIEAVVNDAGRLKHSQGNVEVTSNLPIGGIWFVDTTEAPFSPNEVPWSVRITGDSPPDLEIGESSEVFYPVGRRDPVRITDSIRGYEGTVSGTVEGGYVDGFMFLKHPNNQNRIWRLIYGDVNIPVQLGAAATTHTDWDTRQHAVSIEVTQVSEFPGGG